jgi:hypothetical protein
VDQPEAAPIEVVDACTSVSFVMKYSRSLECLDMPGRRRPGMIEYGGDLAGRHRPAVEVQRDENSPARRVRERHEDHLVCIQGRFGLLPRRAFRHRGYI